MRISVSEAKAQLTDLVRHAEEGEEVVLTRHGKDVARIAAIKARVIDRGERLRILETARAAGRGGEPSAARSQDFLYGDDGLPK